MLTQERKVRQESCPASATCEDLSKEASLTPVNADVAEQVRAEFDRYLQMRSAARKVTGKRRRTMMPHSQN